MQLIHISERFAQLWPNPTSSCRHSGRQGRKLMARDIFSPETKEKRGSHQLHRCFQNASDRTAPKASPKVMLEQVWKMDGKTAQGYTTWNKDNCCVKKSTTEICDASRRLLHQNKCIRLLNKESITKWFGKTLRKYLGPKKH